jgi:hypothetical protein
VNGFEAAASGEYGVMPFWFWNDDLDEAEIVRQIADFDRHGVGGFVIHPRVGLPRRLGWMSDALLRFYAVAVAEARRRGLRILLYDEGMYPSGSSSGQVVAADPLFACRCLDKIDLDEGEAPVLYPGENLAATLRRPDGRRLAVIDRVAGSVIRGLHYIDGGPAEDEPPAADILNPAAVAAFIRLVYDRFADRFGADFGSTIIGVFTDEPALLGRAPGAPGRGGARDRAGQRPGTTGVVPEISRILGYDFGPHLAALWYDDEADAARYRRDWEKAINLRLEETYYRQLSLWCEGRGVALAGHPHKGDEIGPLRYFQIPGQDAVWRWILPGDGSALEGPESTQAKCAASAMVHRRRRRNANECCGAYGRELSWDEMNWLAKWGFVRGLNMVIPHAFYYSMRGPRADERPPDVGPNSPWWDRFPDYAGLCRRLSWLNTDSLPLCGLAILGEADRLPWRAAKICFQNQIDFHYLEERDLSEATIDSTAVRIAGLEYAALIVEHEPAPAAAAALAPFAAAGRVILAMPDRLAPDAAESRRLSLDLLGRISSLVAPTIRVSPARPALRARAVVKDGIRYDMLFNEERAPIDFVWDEAGGGSGEGASAGVGSFSGQLLNPVTGSVSRLEPGATLHLDAYELAVAFRPARRP